MEIRLRFRVDAARERRARVDQPAAVSDRLHAGRRQCDDSPWRGRSTRKRFRLWKSRLFDVKRSSSPARTLKSGRPQRVRRSAAAAKSTAIERERIRRMSPMDRALLALDLGERMSALAALRDERV